ncbi:MAG: hypothetical protein II787_04620 [Lachnospiraceae bacterium]|nr:hypothetical protein [Lachnospiraceae bacterium]
MATTVYTTIDDVEALFRTLSEDEKERAAQLIPIVEDAIRQEAINRGRNLDEMVENGQLITNVLVSVVVDVIGRTLNTSTTAEPMSQYSQSALGYSMSGTYLVPGGGLFIKNNELRRLGIVRQRWGSVDMLGGA